MFGSDNQNNQQQDHTVSSFGAITPADQVVADGSLSNDDTSSSGASKSTNDLVQDVAAPSIEPTSSVQTEKALSIGSADDLLNIKRSALQDLSPLVGHIDQTPEEKFRTTMMMIQASDDQSLIKTAYEAAQKITDDKARAQALLDVINEINYFTQQHNS